MRRTSRMAGRDDDGGWEGIEAQGERKDFLWAASLRLEAFGRSAQSIERARESEELVDGSKKEAYGEKSRRETRGSMLVFFLSHISSSGEEHSFHDIRLERGKDIRECSLLNPTSWAAGGEAKRGGDTSSRA